MKELCLRGSTQQCVMYIMMILISSIGWEEQPTRKTFIVMIQNGAEEKKKMYSLTPNRSHYYYNRLKEMQVSLIKQTEYTLIFLIVSQMHQLISIKHAVNIYLVTI